MMSYDPLSQLNKFQDELSENSPKCLNYLFLINPKSGQGKAVEMFANIVVPVIEDFVEYQVIVTDHSGQATEIARCLDVSKWDALIVVSGDGLVHEVFNGLVSRPDYQSALHFPIGILPGGSGNALVTCLMHLSGGPTRINAMLPAAHLLKSHDTAPINLIHVQSGSKDAVAFLSFGLGLLPDIDIDSESLRLLGIVRFTIYAFFLCFKPKRYKVRLSYKPAPASMTTPIDQNNNDVILPPRQPESSRVPVSKVNHVNGSLESAAAPESSIASTSSSELASSGDENGESGRPKASGRVDRSRSTYQPHSGSTDQYFGSISNPRYRNKSSHAGFCLDRSRVNRVKCLKPIDLKQAGRKDFPDMSPSEFRARLNSHDVIHMPSLGDPVPDDWVKEEDTYSLLFASFVSHIGEDMYFTPHAKLNDSVIYLTVARRLTVRQLTQVCFGLAPGIIQKLPFIETIPVLGFRFEPLEDGPVPNIVIDGELLPGRGPVQACVTNLASTLLGVKKGHTA